MPSRQPATPPYYNCLSTPSLAGAPLMMDGLPELRVLPTRLLRHQKKENKGKNDLMKTFEIFIGCKFMQNCWCHRPAPASPAPLFLHRNDDDASDVEIWSDITYENVEEQHSELSWAAISTRGCNDWLFSWKPPLWARGSQARLLTVLGLSR